MTGESVQLPWLPEPPADFDARLAAASTGDELRALANHRLDFSRLNRLGKLLARAEPEKVRSLAPISACIVSNGNFGIASMPMVGTACRFGLHMTALELPAIEAFTDQAQASLCAADCVLVALDHRAIPLPTSAENPGVADAIVEHCLDHIKATVQAIRARTSATLLLQNLAPPPETLLGSMDRRLPGSIHWVLNRVNLALDDWSLPGVFVVDIAALASDIGLSTWHDNTYWDLAKLPLSTSCLPRYADLVCRTIAATMGKSRKCLVLDLDNTLWGGLVGEEGPDGVKIGQGNATGEAFLRFQKSIAALRSKGIVLAVCSKNDADVAIRPFRENPDMVLQESDFAIFQANWTDKAANIRMIAEQLELGLDSMVFVDDSAAERMLVRQILPEVAVPEMPADPALFERTLLAAGYFETTTIVTEDLQRADDYSRNAKRKRSQLASSDIRQFLANLKMKMVCSFVKPNNASRAHQLTNKSNQFNPTTRRYAAVEFNALAQAEDVFVRQFRLSDAFGDQGIISVVICRMKAQAWEIENWVMSCRVLGREVEVAVLQNIAEHALSAGARVLTASYIPSPRNGMVCGLYAGLGFRQTSIDADGTTSWSYDLTLHQERRLEIEVEDAV